MILYIVLEVETRLFGGLLVIEKSQAPTTVANLLQEHPTGATDSSGVGNRIIPELLFGKQLTVTKTHGQGHINILRGTLKLKDKRLPLRARKLIVHTCTLRRAE